MASKIWATHATLSGACSAGAADLPARVTNTSRPRAVIVASFAGHDAKNDAAGKFKTE